MELSEAVEKERAESIKVVKMRRDMTEEPIWKDRRMIGDKTTIYSLTHSGPPKVMNKIQERGGGGKRKWRKGQFGDGKG